MNVRALVLAMIGLIWSAQARAVERPNVLWITCEDISPDLGCYGDPYAVTPRLDRLASESVRYTRAFATIGVCAPARSTIITGMYPPSIGTQHMRCKGQLPAEAKEFPRYLREVDYYCTNNSKTDYNFTESPATWDESSGTAHWRNRPEGQPFFAVFNLNVSHESMIRLPEPAYRKRTADLSATELHDPANAAIPPYHPDTPEVRRDWARYADMITLMDRGVGAILDELEADGLAESTIVFFYSDHGAGMPRSKRWLYDSSTLVPFLLRVPERFEELAPGPPGSSTDRLVSFVDLAPTVLSLAGLPIPARMQGTAFLGAAAGEPRENVYGFRDRMDERYDLIRSVRDARYKYIRNYLPMLPYFGGQQYISYMYEMPTMQVWQQLADAGQLTGPAAIWMADRKPPEELYDTLTDPWEVHNLADDPAHREPLEQLRETLRAWETEIVDLGFLPEPDLRTRFGEESPYDAVRRDPGLYPFADIRDATELASNPDSDPDAPERLADLLNDPDPAVRWWAATGLGGLGARAGGAVGQLNQALNDETPWVRVAAADALARLDRPAEAIPTLTAALEDPNPWTRLWAINVLDRLDQTAVDALPAIRRLLDDRNDSVVRVAERALEAFAEEEDDESTKTTLRSTSIKFSFK